MLLVDTHDPHVMQSEPFPVTRLCPLPKFRWWRGFWLVCFSYHASDVYIAVLAVVLHSEHMLPLSENIRTFVSFVLISI